MIHPLKKKLNKTCPVLIVQDLQRQTYDSRSFWSTAQIIENIL